jgi:phosphate transport system permease protein
LPLARNAQTFPGLAGERSDRRFFVVTTAAGGSVFVLLVAIAVFLIAKAAPALHDAGWSFFTEKRWSPDSPDGRFGIVALAFGTVMSSLLALAMALPIALGCALVVVELAPKRLATAVGSVVDVLAAVPSVVYGLWGVLFLVPHLVSVGTLLDAWLGWIPLLENRSGAYGRSVFAASVVLAIMILPIIAALAREVFAQVPRSHKEAALALGATRWEMIRLAILPYGRAGIAGAAMLGLGRALGETIAVALVLSATFTVNIHVLEPGGNTIAANIATLFGEAGDAGRSALIASGLVLFVITLLVNLLARAVVYRGMRTVR